MKRRVMAMTAGAVLLAVVAAGLAVSSSATARGEICPDNRLCVWENNEGGGELVKIRGRGVSNKLADKMNNEASSLVNATDVKVFLYDRKNAEGESRCFDPGEEVADLGAHSGYNDIASSTRIARGDTCPVDDPPRARRGPPCPEQALCVFEHNDYAGQRVVIKRKGVSNKLFKRLDDGASSVINTRGKFSNLYEDKNGEGNAYCVEPDSAVNDLAGYNDLASSSKNARKQECPA